MKEQSEALRLADELERDKWHVPAVVMQAAADELRRLHAEVERLSWDSIHTCHSECQRPLCRLTRERDALRQIVEDFPPIEAELAEVSDRAHRLETQRDALLEVVDKLEYSFDGYIKRYPEEAEVNAAIKAVEGEKA